VRQESPTTASITSTVGFTFTCTATITGPITTTITSTSTTVAPVWNLKRRRTETDWRLLSALLAGVNIQGGVQVQVQVNAVSGSIALVMDRAVHKLLRSLWNRRLREGH
jgi:hypothetical protein